MEKYIKPIVHSIIGKFGIVAVKKTDCPDSSIMNIKSNSDENNYFHPTCHCLNSYGGSSPVKDSNRISCPNFNFVSNQGVSCKLFK